MTCPNCRHPLPPGASVCSNCGRRVAQSTRSASPNRKNTVLIICAIVFIIAILAAGLYLVTRVVGSFGDAETELQYTTEQADAPSADMLREAWENKAAQSAEPEADAVTEAPTIITVPEEPEPEPEPLPEPEPAPETEAEPDTDGYIFPDSDTRYLTEAEVRDKTAAELRIARNEIYARHGRMFTSEDLDAHFRATSWYEPRYTAVEFDALGASMLNQYESANIDLILEIESQFG